MYVVGKSYENAGAAHIRAAELHTKSKSEFDAASSYQKAGEAYGRLPDADARSAAAFTQAIELFEGLGKCAMAANIAKKLAESLEAADDVEGAIAMNQRAIDNYEGEGRPQAAAGCREKMAFLSGSLGAYGDAQAAFEELGRASLQSNLGKFNAKKWFTNALLCMLAREDVVQARNKLLEFKSLDSSFNGTREALLVEALVEACEAGDAEGLATAAAEYDQIKKLDAWLTKILLHIKSHLGSLDPAAGEDDFDAAPEEDAAPDDLDENDLPDMT